MAYQMTIPSCVVSDLYEGTKKETGRTFQLLTFVDTDSWHEFKIFVPDSMHENARRIPQRVPVSLYFEVGQGRNQSLSINLCGWDVVS